MSKKTPMAQAAKDATGQAGHTLWPLLVEWRASEVNHAAILCGLREGDLAEAADRMDAAARNLRIEVDRIHHDAPSVEPKRPKSDSGRTF
jgi:hypothetical protein